MIFPLIFLFCLVFLQLALYFATLEYAEALCDGGLLMAADAQVQDGEIEQALYQRMSGNSLLSEDTSIQVKRSGFLMFSKIKVSLDGHCRLLFPMEVHVMANGYIEEKETFCRITDLLWECAGRMDELKNTVNQWFGG